MFGFGTEYEGLAFWLPLIWAGLLAVAIAMYVIADGFDLGVGILFNAARRRELARPHDVLGRADLGRQRDLAHPRRRRPLRGVLRSPTPS